MSAILIKRGSVLTKCSRRLEKGIILGALIFDYGRCTQFKIVHQAAKMCTSNSISNTGTSRIISKDEKWYEILDDILYFSVVQIVPKIL